MQLSRANSVDEIEMLYRLHGPALLLLASAIIGDRNLAQDVVHQVFANILEKGNLGYAANAKAYLFASVRNTSLNQIKARRPTVELDEETAWFVPPDQDYAEESRLRNALLMLPMDQRQVVILHIWGELTFSELAPMLDVSSNTAASRYRYALAKLREVFSIKEEPYACSR